MASFCPPGREVRRVCHEERWTTSRMPRSQSMTLTREHQVPVTNMVVSIVMGGNPKWLVYRANRIKMDDLGVPPFMETTNIVLMILLSVMGDLNFGTPVFPTFLVAGSELDAASL